MIIKSIDDKRPQIDALQGLLTDPACDATTRKRIEQEIRNIRAGMRGEEEAAYEMKVYYGANPNWMVIHDLRIEHDGLVAQIDHLVISRLLEIWVCESKHFAEGVAINEQGEFTAFYGSKPYGVPSPIEQNDRHILILKRLFDSGVVKLPTRLGFTIKPDLKSLVLVSKSARITRPKASMPGIERVIKNDQLATAISKAVNESNPLTLAKLVARDTVESVAKSIAALHKPIEFDWRAKFGLKGPTQPAAAASPDGDSSSTPPAAAAPAVASAAVSPAAEEQTKPRQKLICHACSASVPYNVAKFCWFNKPKFGGNIFCLDCQKQFS